MKALSSSVINTTTVATAFLTTLHSPATIQTPTFSSASKSKMVNGKNIDFEFVLVVPGNGNSNSSPHSSRNSRRGFILQPRRQKRPNLYDEAVPQSLVWSHTIHETTGTNTLASSIAASGFSMTNKENEPSVLLGYDTDATPSHQVHKKLSRRATISAELSPRHYPSPPPPPRIEAGEFPHTSCRLPNLPFLKARSQSALQRQQRIPPLKLGLPLLPLLQQRRIPSPSHHPVH